MTHKAIDPKDYAPQLQAKQQRLRDMLAPYYQDDLTTFASPPMHYRMRAEFRVWHDGDALDYIMFDPDTKSRITIDRFLPGSEVMNQLMQALIPLIKKSEILRRKLFQVDFLTTTTGQAVISLLYHRQLEDSWQVEATELQAALQQLSLVSEVNLIGRAKKQKLVVGNEYVTETLEVQGRKYLFQQIENSFTQPNAAINQHMVEWALDATKDSAHDLLELYCGNGNFSLPLAQNFRKVLATEISKSSVYSAQHNIALNKVDNLTMLRMSAEEFTAVMDGQLDSRRAREAEIDTFECHTVLVDPPRAGVDDDTLELLRRYEKIVYISCNPDTLLTNIQTLANTHKVERAALFDQFPYTEHMESGVVLVRK